MRKPLIAANWKMYKTVKDSVAFVKEFKDLIKDKKNVDVVICPPFTSLGSLSNELKNSNINLGAQNLYYEKDGAFTGEISPLMIKELCSFVIIGHSERRQIFKETDEDVNKKVKAALKVNLKVILCIGETLDQRENNETFNIIEIQLKNCLKDVSSDDMKAITIAYEPIWAIGTGKNAAPKQAEEVQSFIRVLLLKIYDKELSEKTRILYGGSVKPENIKELMNEKDIDGALVGGASLKADSFANIVDF